MKQALYKTFHIAEGEGYGVFLLILQSFFLGVFYGSLDISASALFLKAFPASMLPKAFVISGIAGIVLTAVYTRLQNRIAFSKLAVINLLSITLIIAILRIAYYFTSSQWLPFLILVMMGPLNIIALLGFWGIAGRVFTLRQGKRLFGLIDSGQVFGVIISSYTIPLILFFGFSTIDLLYLCSGSIIAALTLQFIISRKLKIDSTEEVSSNDKKSILSIKDMVKNKFILYMSVFVTLSMICAFFIYYSFLAVTNTKYPDAEELAKFLGLFTGTLMVFSFFFKAFIYSKIMQTYNLRISLLILPILLLLLSMMAVVVGFAFGYTAESAGFLLFFMLISLSRLFSRSLKESLEAPSFKILYLTLDHSVRYDVQARIDGVVNEFAALFSGIILAGLGIFSFIGSIHYVAILIALLIIWVFVTIRLYSEYKRSLISSMKYNKITNNDIPVKRDNTIDDYMSSSNPETVLLAMEILQIKNPLSYDIIIDNLLQSPHPDIRIMALKIILEKELIQFSGKISKFIKNEQDTNALSLAEETRDALADKKIVAHSKEQLISLIQSKKERDRIFAIKIIEISDDDIFYSLLIALLRDHNYYVRIEAIKACANIRLFEACSFLIDCLSDTTYSIQASEALIKIGHETIEPLEIYFYKSDLDINIQRKIIHIFGKIGNEKAIGYLIQKLNYPVREIAKASLNELSKHRIRFIEDYTFYIRHAIDLTISVISWNLNVLDNMKTVMVSEDLKKSLNDEILENYQLLFKLLAIIYDEDMIATVKDNIENGSNEGISYSLELLDLYVADDLKPVLFPLFDSTNISEKVKKLQDFYAFERYNAPELLYAIVQRDCNFISRWTKTLAIYNLLEYPEYPVKNDLLAHMFNNDRLLFESAGYVIRTLNIDAYKNVSKRLEYRLSNELDYIINASQEKKFLLMIEIIRYLKKLSYLKDYPVDLLIDIAEKIEEKTFKRKQIILEKSDKNSTAVFFILSGELAFVSESMKKLEFLKHSAFTLHYIIQSDSPDTKIVATRDCDIYCISRDNYQILLSENPLFSELISRLIFIRQNI